MSTSLATHLRRACSLPLAVVGIGNPMRGDDGAGPAIVAALPDAPDLARFDAGMAPENWLGPIARAQPRTVLVVDAVDTGDPPGTLQLLRPDAVAGGGVSTHALPLDLFLRTVEERCGAPCLLLAIQPQTVEMRESLSAPVQRAVRRAARAIASLTRSPRRSQPPPRRR
ncbi:MAG: hydrogenase 3 maturation endopeptidase HyCI [Planctomycetes bacterium]|nr:hydrogenase 3 maturation endopeptidase HyCI [Planctomycetota bacterium]